jgi:hypothetical protein
LPDHFPHELQARYGAFVVTKVKRGRVWLGTIPKNMAIEDDATTERDVLPMRTILGCAALALAFSTATIPAQAKGCIKGALIGGTAGHFAGHHGLLGAAAGCVIGRHEANRQRQLKLQQQNAQPGTAHYR